MLGLNFDNIDKQTSRKIAKLKDDPYLNKKYNRDLRIQQKMKYFNNHFINIDKGLNKKKVIDIGPAFGEFLEVCKFHNFGNVLGIDAKSGDCMGNPYYELSEIMCKVQNIPVEYCGLLWWIHNNKLKNDSVCIINSQGSIEQAFTKYINGDNHRGGQSVLKWIMNDELKYEFIKFIEECKRLLCSKGVLMIYGNGTSNVSKYNNLIVNLIEDIGGMKIKYTDCKRLHRIVKL